MSTKKNIGEGGREGYLTESPQPKAAVLRDGSRVVGPRSKANDTETAKGLQAVRCLLIASIIAQAQLAICVGAPHQHCAGWLGGAKDTRVSTCTSHAMRE
jgi:hypothetical protein